MDGIKNDRKPTRWKHFDYNLNRVYFLTICTKDKICILSKIVSHIDTENDMNASIEKRFESRDGFMPEVELTDTGKVVDKYIKSINNVQDVFVDKYVIMPNHIHMLLVVKNHEWTLNFDDSMNSDNSAVQRANKTVPHIISTFKRFCNKEIGYDIFQRSYYDHVIRSVEDYDECARYILHNPRRWYLKYKIPKR
jgi:REP element-mobilizing transposase RayT